jgi:Tol biopolymer transport system component
MVLAPGVRLGSYEVAGLLGSGGMGEVYRATDTNLKRAVAIKVLPETLASDPDRLARFQREAEILASLNHPNIAAIFGLERVGATTALVMELVEGTTLADRIARGPLPVDEALSIARQIADALEAAHEQGIVHRDLKPANVVLRSDATVKVLDFGLAKAIDNRAPGVAASESPTVPSPVMTGAGVILGTAAYMSPEQTRGQAADTRSDVWAFGCVLYEMLTARRAFGADAMPDTLAAVLLADPEWEALPAVPEPVQTLLRRCLEKDRRQRLRNIGDARLAIDDAVKWSSRSPEPLSFERERRRWLSIVLGLSLAALVALSALASAWRTRPAPLGAEVRFEITTPRALEEETLGSIAISPDARRIAYVAPLDGRPHVWLRALDSVEPRPLTGTEHAYRPFWSGNGRSLGFFTDDGVLKRIDLDGGLVRTLTTVASGAVASASWNADETILFAPNPAGPILGIPADGGVPTPVTRLDTDQSGHVSPRFLPDGRHFLYFVIGKPEAAGVYVDSIDRSSPRRLAADSSAMYASGHLIFVRRGTVLARPFDLERRVLSGTPVTIAEGAYAPSLSTAAGGAVAFRVGSSATTLQQFVWVDKSGTTLATLGSADATLPLSPSLSPNGRSVAFLRRVDANADVWLLETRRGVLSRLTDHLADDLFPIWSHDGDEIFFTSNRDAEFAVYRRAVTTGGSETKVVRGPLEVFANDVSPDGGHLLFARRAVETRSDLWALPLSGGTEVPIARTDADERDGQFSPNGKWLAYGSNRSGRFEVYVQPFPGPGTAVPVSNGGGAQARWDPGGKELYYIALDGVLMSVPIEVAADGQSIIPGAPVPLFPTSVGRVLRGNPGAQYVVSAQGTRFLLNNLVTEKTSTTIQVIVNWRPGQSFTGR